VSAAKAKRLRPGELDGLVLAYLAEHKGDGPLTATAIGKGIERSAGAVANCLVRLAKDKEGAPSQETAARLRRQGGEVAMCQRCGGRTGRRRLFPEQTPPGLNYAVVTGTLLDDPREGGGPDGTPVLVMEIEFPVAPEHPRLLWTYATYEVEVPGDVGGRHVEELKKGAPVLVAGRLSERCSLEDGRASCRGAIVANLIHPGPPPEQPGGSFGARYMP